MCIHQAECRLVACMVFCKSKKSEWKQKRLGPGATFNSKNERYSIAPPYFYEIHQTMQVCDCFLTNSVILPPVSHQWLTNILSYAMQHSILHIYTHCIPGIDFPSILIETFFFLAECEDLIKHMLVVDADKRYTLRQIACHRWMHIGCEAERTAYESMSLLTFYSQLSQYFLSGVLTNS